MAKTYKHRWRDRQGTHRQKTFESRAERDNFIARLRLEPEKVEPPRVTFREFARGWIDDYAKVEKSETQWRQDERILELHINPAIGDVQLKDLKDEHLLMFRRRLIEEKIGRYRRRLRPKTANNILSLAKQIAGIAAKRGKLPANPFGDVDLLPVHSQPYGYWTAKERDTFLIQAKRVDPAFQRLVLVAVYTGLRKGELWALQRGQLDFQNKVIVVSATYDHKLRRRLERTKDGGWGAIPMHDLVYEALKDEQLKAPSAQVFPDELIGDAVHRLRRLCLVADVPVIRFHDLRHTFASLLVMARVPIYDVQKLMRHKSIQMTERYAHLAPGHLKEAVDALTSVRVSVRAQPESVRDMA
jgi:integrase